MTDLNKVRSAVRILAKARARTAEAEDFLADAIRGALANGVRAADIAATAGITRQRVYQIRDGKR
jgi:hypothetical protein